jgi:hypothetical protein
MTETAIERAPRHAIRASRLAQVSGFTDQVIALVAQTVAQGASRQQLAWFLYNAGRLEADPILREIYWIPYDKKQGLGTIVPGIGLYRKQAEASGVYAGSDQPEFEYDPALKVPHGGPAYARVTVYKMLDGQRCPFVGESRWVEDYPGEGPQGAQYRLRPWNQLAVRAESRALRKAFPRQAQHIETVHAAPVSWQEAAQEDVDAQNDPEVVERNARLYDEFFDPDRTRAISPPGARAGSQAAAERSGSPSPSPDPQPEVTVRSPLAERLADLMEQAAALEVDYADSRVSLPAPYEEVMRAIQQLEGRLSERLAVASGPS